MIKVIYAMLVIIIENLEMRFDNSNLLLKKNIIGFELLAQKEKINKQMTDILYY